MSEINIGLAADQRKHSADILKSLLADEYVLYTKTRKYHWNVEGPDFHILHKFLEEQYDMIDEFIDEIAERVRQLGEYSTGSLADFLAATRIKEDSGAPVPAKKLLANLLADHEAIIRHVRADIDTIGEKYHDVGNQDFLTGIMKAHEKAAWMLRALLA